MSLVCCLNPGCTSVMSNGAAKKGMGCWDGPHGDPAQRFIFPAGC